MNKRIKQLRKTLGLNQKQFGESIGLKANSISYLEQEGFNVTEQNIKSICREFNVNEDWLRNGTGDMFEELSTDEEIGKYLSLLVQDDDHLKKDLILTLLKLDDEDWTVIKKIINSLKK